ncbi:MAG: PAS domain S-box protein, partial [Desulfobacterales bacterium]
MTTTQILIVEDERIIAEDTRMSLETMGYAVSGIVAEGLAAIDRARALGPDLVLMDIFLRGDMDGIEAARQIQSHLNIPVVFLTAHADQSLLDRIKASEPFGFLLKPIDERELAIAIEMALYRSQMEQSLQQKTHDLDNRIKALDCLYGISYLRDNQHLSLKDTLQGIVDLLPPSWQYPEITSARIILDEEKYVTENFAESSWKQASRIKMHGETVGSVEVFYTDKRPESDEGPFTHEERSLLNAVAERLDRIIERKIADQTLRTALEQSQQRQAEISALLKSLETSEERTRSVVETANDAIISIDNKGDIVFWNRGAESMFGYPSSTIIGKPVARIMPEQFREIHEDRMRQTTAQLAGTLAKPLILSGLRKGGCQFPIELSLASWKTADGTFFTGIIRDITERIAVENALRNTQNELEKRVHERTAELSKANQELQRLSNKLLDAHEEESKRIGQELHDGLAQSLSAIKVWIENAIVHIGQDRASEDIVRSLESAVDLARRAVEDVRRISRNLRPSILDDLGILATISWLCQEFESVYDSIHIEKQIDIDEEDIPEPLKLVIFRIMQETFSNIAKHSRADQSRIFLRKQNGKIELTIDDNGIG